MGSSDTVCFLWPRSLAGRGLFFYRSGLRVERRHAWRRSFGRSVDERSDACFAEAHDAFVDLDCTDQAAAGEIAGGVTGFASGANEGVDFAEAEQPVGRRCFWSRRLHNEATNAAPLHIVQS